MNDNDIREGLKVRLTKALPNPSLGNPALPAGTIGYVSAIGSRFVLVAFADGERLVPTGSLELLGSPFQFNWDHYALAARSAQTVILPLTVNINDDPGA